MRYPHRALNLSSEDADEGEKCFAVLLTVPGLHLAVEAQPDLLPPIFHCSTR
jgi:hypothetical protein